MCVEYAQMFRPVNSNSVPNFTFDRKSHLNFGTTWLCIVTLYFSGFSRADDAAETATETVDADIGSSREGSRTGKNLNSCIVSLIVVSILFRNV